jgi:hypothetical protein
MSRATLANLKEAGLAEKLETERWRLTPRIVQISLAASSHSPAHRIASTRRSNASPPNPDRTRSNGTSTHTRSPEKTDGIAAANVDHAALDAAGAAAAAHSREIALLKSSSASTCPYERNLFVLHAKQLIGEVGLKSLQIGLILIQIKAHESHGDF